MDNKNTEKPVICNSGLTIADIWYAIHNNMCYVPYIPAMVTPTITEEE